MIEWLHWLLEQSCNGVYGVDADDADYQLCDFGAVKFLHSAFKKQWY